MRTLLAVIVLLIVAAAPVAAAVYSDYYGPYGGDTVPSWQQDYVLNNKSHATPPFAPQQTFGGCYIADAKGALLADLDCDKVPDIVDNCVGVANPDQADQNHNGLGDACDLVVDSIAIDPPVVLEGRAFTVTATLTNYRSYDLRNLEFTVQVPELGLEQKQYLDVIKSGDQVHEQFFLRLPACVPKSEYDVVFYVDWPKSPGVQESFYIPTKMGTAQSGLCAAESPTAGKSIVNILNIQDIDPVNGGDYPFTIQNNEQESQAYVLSVQGTDGWGSYEIKPRSLIVVPAGGSQQGILTIYADKGATGEHGFVLTIKSNTDAKQEMLTARIKQQLPGTSARSLIELSVFVVGVILLLLAFSLAMHRKMRK